MDILLLVAEGTELHQEQTDCSKGNASLGRPGEPVQRAESRRLEQVRENRR